jgi:ER lumen protein retaining receptor
VRRTTHTRTARARARLSHPHSPGALFNLIISTPLLPSFPPPAPPLPSGISLKTQILYTLVFATRYLDLATRWVSLYNTVMKAVFLGASAAILWLMTRARGVRGTYDASHDTFRIAFLIVPCAALAALVHADASPLELAWTFSIYLEAVAILPQLVLLQRTGNVDNLTGDYVFLLGLYRGLYLVNWVYRAWTEPGYRQWIGERRGMEEREWSDEREREGVKRARTGGRPRSLPLLSTHSPPSPPSLHSLGLRHGPDRPLPGLLLLLPARLEAQREAEPAVLRGGEGGGERGEGLCEERGESVSGWRAGGECEAARRRGDAPARSSSVLLGRAGYSVRECVFFCCL